MIIVLQVSQETENVLRPASKTLLYKLNITSQEAHWIRYKIWSYKKTKKKKILKIEDFKVHPWDEICNEGLRSIHEIQDVKIRWIKIRRRA